LTLTITAVPQEPEEPEETEQPDEPVQTGPPTYRALLVGINIYDPSYVSNNLYACVNDAKDIRDELLVGQLWKSKNVQMLTNSRATKSAIRRALQTLASESGPNDTIVYYHSGHGGQRSGKATYICAHDTSYTDEQLGSDLARFSSGQKVIVVVDACHSGGLFKDAGWPFAEQVMQAYHYEKSAQMKAEGGELSKDLGSNVAFMVACNYDQTCIERAGNGLYTSFLLDASTLASVDKNSDGKFQFFELHQYAADKSSQENPRQTAQQYNKTLLSNTAVKEVGNAGSGSQSSGFDNPYQLNTEVESVALVPMTCGAGAAQTMMIGLCGLLGVAVFNRRH
jgi:hypothetical protein